MKDEILFKEDYLDLGEQRKKKIEYIVSDYLRKIESADQCSINFSDVLFVIAEAFTFLCDQEKWLNKSYELIQKISDDIVRGKYEYQTGLIVGLCEIGFITNLLRNKSNHYEKFLHSLNKYIIQRVEAKVKRCEMQMTSLKTQDYDVIYGLSGSGIYLLECEASKERNDVLCHILVYFSKLILDTHLYQEMEVPNWHILGVNHFMDYDKKYYSLGSFNFGVSHGIIAIYSFANQMYRANIEKDLAQKISDNIEKIYMKYCKLINNCRFWPGRLKFDEFIMEEYVYNNYRQSWCYGSIGINAVILKEAYLNHNENLIKMMYNNMEEIAKMPIEEYELNSPIICHGYAGVLEIFINAYKISNNNVLHKRICELLDIIIDMHEFNSKYGYKDTSIIWGKEGNFQTILKEDTSFLEGASGIILVLLSAYISNTEFQKILLL